MSCWKSFVRYKSTPLQPGLARRFVVKIVFPWVASRANMLHLAACTHNRAVLCLHVAHIATVWEFWTDWLPTDILFLPHKVTQVQVEEHTAAASGALGHYQPLPPYGVRPTQVEDTGVCQHAHTC